MNVAISRKRPGLLYALAVALPFTAQAEETVVVTATPPASASAPTEGYSASTSLGATKTDQPLITTAQSVSVVTRQQMADRGRIPSAGRWNIPRGLLQLRRRRHPVRRHLLRGYHGGDVDNLFLDGMRLMSDGGSHNVLQIDPWFIERVDVIRGPSSALYGQSVPGGVVNLTSKRPQFSQQGHIRLTGGTQNTKGAAFDYTDAINDQWAWRLIGMTRSSDTQYDHTREERYAISPSCCGSRTATPRCCCAPICKKILPAATTALCRWTAPATRTMAVSSPQHQRRRSGRWLSAPPADLQL